MENKLEKRYGLMTAICMVVGIVIGSGVFFKAQDILNYTNGNILIGILSWLIGGAVLIACALSFATLAGKYEKNNGVVDYAEATVGKRYGYFMGWFISTIYYPSLVGVLAFVSARYTLLLFNPDADLTGGLCIALGAFYICASYAVNMLAPSLSGRFQISSTVIKLIPLVIMAVVGIIIGLINGNITNAFELAKTTSSENASSIFAAVAAAAFAYDGWIIATSINSELKNSKRNLPIALTVGAIIIIAIYTLYFVGITGASSVELLCEKGATVAFTNLFGRIGGSILNAFVVVSCLGTLNGLMLGCTRGMYSLAARKEGPLPETFSSVDASTCMPSNSGAIALLLIGFWYFYFYASTIEETLGFLNFNSSELPIITIYAMYIPIFIAFAVKHGKENPVRNIILPCLAVLASLFMIFAAVWAHGVVPFTEAAERGEFSFPVLSYLLVFVVFMTVGMMFYKKKNDSSF